MKKILFTLLLVAGSNFAFAISNLELAEVCLKTGKSKLSLQAEAWGCDVDLDKMEVSGIDNRLWNPSKYIWYQAPGECNGQDRLITMVQYHKGHCL